MNAKLSPSRLAKATASITDKLRWAKTCLQFASDTRKEARREEKEVFETCLAALEFVKGVEPYRLRQDHFNERMQDEDFRREYEALKDWKGDKKDENQS